MSHNRTTQSLFILHPLLDMAPPLDFPTRFLKYSVKEKAYKLVFISRNPDYKVCPATR